SWRCQPITNTATDAATITTSGTRRRSGNLPLLLADGGSLSAVMVDPGASCDLSGGSASKRRFHRLVTAPHPLVPQPPRSHWRVPAPSRISPGVLATQAENKP